MPVLISRRLRKDVLDRVGSLSSANLVPGDPWNCSFLRREVLLIFVEEVLEAGPCIPVVALASQGLIKPGIGTELKQCDPELCHRVLEADRSVVKLVADAEEIGLTCISAAFEKAIDAEGEDFAELNELQILRC